MNQQLIMTGINSNLVFISSVSKQQLFALLFFLFDLEAAE